MYLIAAAKSALAKITFTDEDGNVIYAESWHPTERPPIRFRCPRPKGVRRHMITFLKRGIPEIQHVTGHATYRAKLKECSKIQCQIPI